MNEDELRERLDNLFEQGKMTFASVDNVFKSTNNVFQQITALSKRLERIERLLLAAQPTDADADWTPRLGPGWKR